MRNLPWSEPEENNRVELIHVRNAQGRQHDKQNEVTQDKVRREITQFGNLAKELTARLGHGVPSHAVPFSSPPSDVGLIMLELTSQGQGDDELVDEPLDGSHGDHTKNTPGPRPALEEKHDLENGKQDDHGNGMCDGSKDSTELLTAHTEDGSHTAGHTEERASDTCVDSDRSKSDDCNSQNGIELVAVVGWLLDTGSRVDVEVRDDGDTDQDQRGKNLTV